MTRSGIFGTWGTLLQRHRDTEQHGKVVLCKRIIPALFEDRVAELGAALELLDEWKAISHRGICSCQREPRGSCLLQITDVTARGGVDAAGNRYVEPRREVAVGERDPLFLRALYAESSLECKPAPERRNNEQFCRSGLARAGEIESRLVEIDR